MAARLTTRTYCHTRALWSVAGSAYTVLPTGQPRRCARQESVGLRFKSDHRSRGGSTLSDIIKPLTVSPHMVTNDDDINIGVELTGSLKKEKLLKVLAQFQAKESVKRLAADNGMDYRLFYKAFISFRKLCIESQHLPVDLHIILSDILQGSGKVEDIFPYFLRHSYDIFPHLECMEDLKKISDLRLPANWYPEARSIQRKFIFHAGPTNSGKTHHALQRFLQAGSGLYCGPLKLLASEVYHKTNLSGTRCDLVTGEERRFAGEANSASDHVACTVEMASLTTRYEVAVIDEIQMIRDGQRGWAWTRAVLGLFADEIHVCGEASTIELLKELALTTGDQVEVRRYKRLTDLTYLDRAVEKFENVRPGDCIVCFNKNDIYYVSKQLDQLQTECAVIYGSLPPSTKLAQAQKFNDPDNSCKVLVATDAVGMGLNLAIKRVIFYSVTKPMLNDNGDVEIDLISTSQALQIAGRAGRYNTAYANGEVTTFHPKDLPLLREIVQQPVEPIMQAGLHPTADQIELFAYHLPKASLSNLIDIFEKSCELDQDNFFMCKNEDFKFLADMIEHVPMALRARYVFCCAPIAVKQPFACAMFLKFARRFSRGEPLTMRWLCSQIGWPVSAPQTLVDLVQLENVFDVLDLYLWLGYRFPDLFPEATQVRELQRELDEVIQAGVQAIVQLVQGQERRPLHQGVTDLAQQAKAGRQRKKVSSSHLAQKLMDTGVLSKEVLNRLRQEWADEEKRLHLGGDDSEEESS